MFVSVLIVRAILSDLYRRGIEQHAVLAGTRVDEARLANLAATVTRAEWDVIVSNAVSLARDPALPFAISQRFPARTLQLLGDLVCAANTLREAIQVFMRYAALITDQLAWTLKEEGALAHFGCEPVFDTPEDKRFGLELALGFVVNVGLRLAPQFVRSEIAVEFAFATPSDWADHASALGCHVRFGRLSSAVVFPRVLLDVPRGAATDARVLASLRERADELLLVRSRQGLVERVRAALEHEGDLSHFEPARLAQAFGITERALRRQLAQEGTPLPVLLGEVRHALALRELASRQVCIKTLSERLGFSEPSAFHRAFKRWTGKTPSEYIREQAQATSSRVEA
jgi:AraC-like DNA-binding protein